MNAPLPEATTNDGRAAALRRFPTQNREIDQLLQQSESFIGLCTDLAAAEHALDAVDRVPAALREERRVEFAVLVDALVAEIADTLSRANVVSISGAKRHHRVTPSGGNR